MSKKNVVSAVVAAAEVASMPLTTSVHPIPVAVSAPPDGWVAPTKLGLKGRRPKNGLPLIALTLAKELRENAAALLEELGPKSVDPTQLAAALETANAWADVDAKAATFHLYTRARRSSSWDAALALMGGLRPGVLYALARDPSFADRFPGVAKTFAKRRYKTKKKSAAVPRTDETTHAPVLHDS